MHRVEFDLVASCLTMKLSVHVFDLIELAKLFIVGGGRRQSAFDSIVAWCSKVQLF
jgi:hypothetical protein